MGNRYKTRHGILLSYHPRQVIRNGSSKSNIFILYFDLQLELHYLLFDVSHCVFIFVVGIRNWKSEFTILSRLYMKQGRILPYHRSLLVHLYSVYNSILNFMSGFDVFYCRTGDPLQRLYIKLVRYQSIVVRGPRSPVSEPQFLINITNTNSYLSQHNYSVFTIMT